MTPKYNRYNRSSFAKKRVAEEKQRMELVYGKGLVGLYDENGKVDHTRFGWDNRREATTWITVQQIQINARSAEAFSFGYVEGI